MPILSTAAETVERLDGAIRRTKDERHRAMLEAFRTHWWGEVTDDLDLAMSVLPQKVQFAVRGAVMRPVEIHTAADQRAHYQRTIDLGLNVGGALSAERFAFADWGMMLEATLSSVMTGAMLAPSPDRIPGEVHAQALYLVHRPIAVVMPFTLEGQMLGEIAYMAAPSGIEAVEPSTIRALRGL